MDLLEEAGIPQPPPPIITAEDRAELAGVVVAQRQLFYCFAFAGGLLSGAVLAYLIGYQDEIIGLAQWLISGAGLAVVTSLLNGNRLLGFKCPRCGENFFGGLKMFAKQCQTCGLPLYLHDEDAAAAASDAAPARPA